LAPANAAELYGLTVVARDIADHAGNQTRFVLVSQNGIPQPTGHDKTGIVVFQRADEPGSLISILQEFAAPEGMTFDSVALAQAQERIRAAVGLLAQELDEGTFQVMPSPPSPPPPSPTAPPPSSPPPSPPTPPAPTSPPPAAPAWAPPPTPAEPLPPTTPEQPKWEGLRGVTGDARREDELGAGKWTESARSLAEVQGELAAGPPREIEPLEDGKGSKVFLIIGLCATAGLVLWWIVAG
jgi:hypothetical protein